MEPPGQHTRNNSLRNLKMYRPFVDHLSLEVAERITYICLISPREGAGGCDDASVAMQIDPLLLLTPPPSQRPTPGTSAHPGIHLSQSSYQRTECQKADVTRVDGWTLLCNIFNALISRRRSVFFDRQVLSRSLFSLLANL
jgi:hypothetical protein